MKMPIIDLHCDLLYYLAAEEGRTAHDRQARCSLPQLSEGSVVIQTLAIYTVTGKGSTKKARKQFEIFENLPLKHPQELRKTHLLELPKEEGKIAIFAAIENASGLCEEDEPLDRGLSRLAEYQESCGPLLYVSLTWNEENRFGGGNKTSIGLKKDGEALLDALAQNNIAIDLSHTSDQLAYDIFNYIEKKGLNLRPIASHSNFRAVENQPRNLSDEFAKGIIAKKGLIGLNFVKKFIGSPPLDAFKRQIDHALKIGGGDYLCFGADFFSELDNDLLNFIGNLIPFFHEGYDSSSCYPKLVQELERHFGADTLQKIGFKNCIAFFERMTQAQESAL